MEKAIGIIMIMFFVVTMIYLYWYEAKEKKKRKITSKFFSVLLNILQYHALYNKKDSYLEAFYADAKYSLLEDFYKHFSTLISNYERAILHAPLQLTQPINPYTAATLGTLIGGSAVGMVVAQNTIEKEQAYQKSTINVIDSDLEIHNAHNEVQDCYLSIEAILEKNEYTKNDWNKEKQLILNKLNSEYKIVHSSE